MKRFLILLCSSFFLILPQVFSQLRSSIVIVSTPVTVTKVGSTYQYQVKVYSSRSDDIFRYRLATAPLGMTIDSIKGLIQWQPKSVGIFPVEVVVVNQRNEQASQKFSIKVVLFFGTITGTVKSDSGKPLARILVTLYPQASTKDYFYRPIYSASTDSLGKYTISNIDSGTYYAGAMPLCYLLMIPCMVDDYLPVWYVDSPSIAGAAPIVVKDSNKIVINFTMHRRVPPTLVSVSGTVTDTVGKPIRGATVVVSEVLRSPVTLNAAFTSTDGYTSSSLFDSEFGWFPNVVGYAKTDSLGRYRISVFAGNTYVALSFASGYKLEYYKERANALEADRMTLVRDTSNVNFTLAPLPKITTKVSGAVRDSAGVGVPSKVILYPRSRIKLSSAFERTVHTDSLGNFVFQGVSDGSYLLQAIPFRMYLPSFYKANACGVVTNRNADTIVEKGSDIAGIVVCVKKASVSGGGRISGRVNTSDGKLLSGVLVNAQSQNDVSIATYATTGADGTYELLDLDQGTYVISVDKVGYQSSQSSSKSIDYQSGVFSGQSDFQMAPEGVTSVTDQTSQLPVTIVLFQNYPNPFNPRTSFEFQVPHLNGGQTSLAFVSLKIFDVLGREVATLVYEEKSPGTYKILWDAASFPSGVYLYQMQVGSFVETKKMVLVK